MPDRRQFRLLMGAWSAVRLPGFLTGDEVCGAKLISFAEAKERVNGDRTRLSPRKLVLLKGTDEKKSRREVLEILVRRPWEPDPTPPSAA